MQEAKDVLDVAEDLFDRHKENPENDRRNSLLRGSAELVWLASLRGCQAILIRAKAGMAGGAQDASDASDYAETEAEKHVARLANQFAGTLHSGCFYRGDCAVGAVFRGIKELREQLRKL